MECYSYLKADDSVGPGVNIGKIYQEGCIKALGNWINSNALVAGGILLGFLIPQVTSGFK